MGTVSRSITGIVHVTGRAEVENLDTERFLFSFGPHIGRKELRKLCGMVHFTISGYDDTREEIYAIPEVRRYYGHLHKVFPCWLFYSNLASPCLRAVMLAIIPNVRILRSKHKLSAEFRSTDVHSFFMESLPAAALLHARAGISKQRGARQLAMTAQYLGIPDK